MRRHRRAEPIRKRAQVALLPEVSHELLTGEADVRPARRDGGRLQTAIEERDRFRAVGERSDPDLQPMILNDA